MPAPRSQPKTRSAAALAAWLRNGAGKHGGSSRQRNRRDRRKTKIELRKDY